MLLAALSTGCVRVYHPIHGLHEPVIVDPTLPNLEDARVSVHCVPGDLLSRSQASALCRRVQVLFENQGAEVSTVTSAYRSPDDPFTPSDGAPPADEQASEPDTDAPRTELTVELRARQTHLSYHPLTWAAWTLTFTLAPGVTERTFAQDIVVRDASGVRLAARTLEGRTVRRSGAGVWVGNKLADWWWRDADDDLTSANADADLSADLYGQLSQIVFDAKLKQQVLERDVAARRR